MSITINNVFVQKTKKYHEKIQWKSAKTAISGIFPSFSTGKNFPCKSNSAIFWALLIRIFEEKIRKKLMMKSRFFRHISGIFSRKTFFYENRANSHFGHCHLASLCQKPEESKVPITRKAGNGWTGGRTNGRMDKG